MRVRMSSFTCTLTGGSQFAICNLRNLREHFLSKLRRFPKSVDTIKNVVLDLLTTFLHFCILVFWKIRADFKKICPRIFVVSKKKCIFVPSSRRKRLKNRWEKPEERVLRVLWDTIYGKGVYHALCSWRVESVGNSQLQSRNSATIDAHGYVIGWLLIHLLWLWVLCI